MSEHRAIPELCRFQADWCERLGSPLYAHLLRQSADDFDQGGPVSELLAPHDHDPKGSALALRMMGAVHRLALEGHLPELARFYPSCGGTVALEPAWKAFHNTIAEQMSCLRPLLSRPVQTNEIGRCGPLLGGFLLIAHRTCLPFRLLEIGASAGLNLQWDQYRYTWLGGTWGNPHSPIVLQDVFTPDGTPPLIDVTVAERRGCDPDPLDPSLPECRLTLRSFVWADQLERMRNLEQAMAVASRSQVRVERAGAVEWLKCRLAEPANGVATVLFHSIVWQYISQQERKELLDLIQQAGSRATAEAPFAWLRMEPGEESAEIKLAIFPGFEDRIIAAAGYHRPNTLWLGETE
jgi:hypothetical protein